MQNIVKIVLNFVVEFVVGNVDGILSNGSGVITVDTLKYVKLAVINIK